MSIFNGHQFVDSGFMIGRNIPIISDIANYINNNYYTVQNNIVVDDETVIEKGSKYLYDDKIKFIIEYIPSIAGNNKNIIGVVKKDLKFTKEEWSKYGIYILIFIHNCVTHIGDSSKPELHLDYEVHDDLSYELWRNKSARPSHSIKLYLGYQYAGNNDDRCKLLEMDWNKLGEWIYRIQSTTKYINIASDLKFDFDDLYIETNDGVIKQISFANIGISQVFKSRLDNYSADSSRYSNNAVVETLVFMNILLNSIYPLEYPMQVLEYLVDNALVVYTNDKLIVTNKINKNQIISGRK
jgi:hypothetical protein